MHERRGPVRLALAVGMLAMMAAGSATASGEGRADPDAAAGAYAGQVRHWRAPEQVHTWIARHFSYDRARALALSETQRARGAPFRIYRPAELYLKASGICVDLSRFAVETLREVAPTSEPRYLRITFDPVRIQGNVLRMHWVASYRENGKYYFFADSHYPDVLSGPHDDVASYIRSYQDARGRAIVSYRLVDSFRKERRKMRRKRAQRRSERAPAPR